MQELKSTDSPTVRTHKRQLVWQILVPFLVLTALIVAGSVLVVTGAASRTRVWADISIIWLIAPLLIFALLFAGLLGVLIYLIAKLTRVTPVYTAKGQYFAALAAAGTRKVADGIAQPVLWVHQAAAAIKSFFDKL